MQVIAITHVEEQEVGEVQSTWICQTPTPTVPLAGMRLATPLGHVVELLKDIMIVTQSSSLSVKESTVKSVARSEPISGEFLGEFTDLGAQ